MEHDNLAHSQRLINEYADALEQRAAILTNPQHPFYIPARVYCDGHGLEREDQLLAAIHHLSWKAFMERSEPYRKMKADWLGLYPTTNYVKTSSVGMSIAAEPNLPDHVKVAFAEIDRVIARIAVECGLEVEDKTLLEPRTPAQFAEQWTAMQVAEAKAQGAPPLVFNEIKKP